MLDDSAQRGAAVASAEPQKETITAEEIADLLHMQPATFLRRRHKLTAAGMPRPIPGTSHPHIWSRALIIAWINRDDRPEGERPDYAEASLDESPHDEAEDGQASYLGNVRRALEARAGVGQ